MKLKDIFSKQRSRGGFTLVELLVVVAIIGILATVVVISYSGAQSKARDAKRKSDFSTIGTALEMYRNDSSTGGYPQNGSLCSFWASTSSGSCMTQWTALGTALSTYFPSGLPVDPTNTGPDILAVPAATDYYYSYASNTTGPDYDLITRLENSSDADRCQLKHYAVHIAPGFYFCGASQKTGWGLDNGNNIYSGH